MKTLLIITLTAIFLTGCSILPFTSENPNSALIERLLYMKKQQKETAKIKIKEMIKEQALKDVII